MRLELGGAPAVDPGLALGVQAPPAEAAVQVVVGDGVEALAGVDRLDALADGESAHPDRDGGGGGPARLQERLGKGTRQTKNRRGQQGDQDPWGAAEPGPAPAGCPRLPVDLL